MAKNYTFGEAVEIIAKGEDMTALADIGKRFPLMLAKVSNVTAVAPEAFVDLAKCFPEHLTANKVNTGIKNLVANEVDVDDEDEETEEVEDEKPVKETKKEKATKDTKKKEKAEKSDDGDDGLDAKTSKELYQMLKEAGLTKGRKFSKKSEMIEALRESGVGADADDEDEGEDEDFDEVDENEETEENPYEGKTAMALFKECKKRKLKVAPKKPAKFYVEALLKDDAEKVENVDEDEDDWGDDEEVEETKKDKVNKGKNKSKEKVEDDEDDDEDWDI